MIRFKITIISFVLTQFVSAQNLVLNGSFEEFITCPDNGGQLNRAKYWKAQPSNGIDFFHGCDVRPIPVGMGIPRKYGISNFELFPRTGIAMGGAFAINGSTDFRQYFKTKLITGLTKDKFFYNYNFG